MSFLPISAATATQYFAVTISTKKSSDSAVLAHLDSSFVRNPVTKLPVALDNKRNRWAGGLGYAAKSAKVTSKPTTVYLAASDPNLGLADKTLLAASQSRKFNISVVGPVNLPASVLDL